jgi:hypothetical protein
MFQFVQFGLKFGDNTRSRCFIWWQTALLRVSATLLARYSICWNRSTPTCHSGEKLNFLRVSVPLKGNIRKRLFTNLIETELNRKKIHLIVFLRFHEPTTQNYWIFELYPSSVILKTRQHNLSETGSVSVLRWVGNTHSVRPLRANLTHWTSPVSTTTAI